MELPKLCLWLNMQGGNYEQQIGNWFLRASYNPVYRLKALRKDNMELGMGSIPYLDLRHNHVRCHLASRNSRSKKRKLEVS